MRNGKEILGILIVVLLSVGTIVPLFSSGFFPMHDDTQVSRIYLMWKALSDGQFPVRWVQDLGYGFGYPIFNFYAPLPYYIGGFLTFLTKDALIATKLVFGIALIGSGLSMFYFVRSFLGVIGGIVAAVSYMYFPYHAVNTYVRGNLSELYAYVFLPLLFGAIYKLYYHKKKKFNDVLSTVYLLAFSFAFIIISHNLSAYMSGFIAAIVCMGALLFTKNKKNFLASVSLALILSVFLSAFYWLPVVFESKYTDVKSQIGGGADVFDHFVCLNQFWNSPWGYTGSVEGCIDGMSFRIGKSNIALLVIGLLSIGWAYYKKQCTYPFFIASTVIVGLVSLVLMMEGSTFIWSIVPGMEYLQFPWRFMNYFALFASVVIGFIAVTMSQYNKKLGVLVSIGIIAATLVVNAKYFVPQKQVSYTASYYSNFTTISYEVSKRSDEYLPPNFVIPRSIDELPKQTIEPTGSVQVSERLNKTHVYEATISVARNSELHINRAYFPSWKVTIDGKQTDISPNSKGFTITVPKGEHTLRAEVIPTPIQKTANGITVIGFVMVIIGIILNRRYGAKKTS